MTSSRNAGQSLVAMAFAMLIVVSLRSCPPPQPAWRWRTQFCLVQSGHLDFLARLAPRAPGQECPMWFRHRSSGQGFRVVQSVRTHRKLR